MLPEIKLIKRKRMLAGITQKELSKISEVSQSMIAKIESEKIEPSYSIVKKLFTSLEGLERKDERKCEDVMSPKIYFIASDKKVKDATKKMKELDISRIPVKNGRDIIGVISENLILDKLSHGIEYDDLLDYAVSEIMNDALPILGKDATVKSIIPLIKETGAVLVRDKEKVVGIISKADLI